VVLNLSEELEMRRREKLTLAVNILRRCGYKSKCVTERFKSEFPFLTDIMEETLVEAQAYLEMSDDEFRSKFLPTMSYDSFKVLIFYYAEQALKGRLKDEIKKPDHPQLALSANSPALASKSR
jgi:hypothetical protein